ncbi:MAG: SUMF1/EgtB/PvdO family nonheme iron enzyme [Deltaproteobacteria bacterium]|nr:SUMF1/EgtB/PvdO family nonheme iron enzyme [Deltaproteobacteria bacterium]
MERPSSNRICPACGEQVQENWKFCPACETSLKQLVCPQCANPVKENWKRCPECEARLFCNSCGRRMAPGYSTCPDCQPARPEPAKSKSPEVFVEPVTGMEFVQVPAGTFMMGDTFGEGIDNEKPVHEVHLDSFYIGKYPVTQGQWKTLISENPSHFKGEMLPVEQVTRKDVMLFIDRLNESNKGQYTFLLPSEAQWEYAARSGGKEEMYSGSNVADLVAWYDENSDGMTHPVGTKAPNGLGIFDMSGNVWEWCLDTFRSDAYRRLQKKNPLCMDGGPDWVIRGGSWNIDAWSVRCARRFSFPGDYYAPGLGFRLVAIISTHQQPSTRNQ